MVGSVAAGLRATRGPPFRDCASTRARVRRGVGVAWQRKANKTFEQLFHSFQARYIFGRSYRSGNWSKDVIKNIKSDTGTYPRRCLDGIGAVQRLAGRDQARRRNQESFCMAGKKRVHGPMGGQHSNGLFPSGCGVLVASRLAAGLDHVREGGGGRMQRQELTYRLSIMIRKSCIRSLGATQCR